MEVFLNASKIALSRLSVYQTIRVVLGNPTCDLDSAICTLIQGLLEYSDTERHRFTDIAVIPVMNIPEKEFRIKTEVVYSLKSHNIPLNLLTFRDQIDLQNIQNDANKKLELILVDHHILADEDVELKPSVVMIIDHRPLDPAWSWPNIPLNIEIVGSCATLVARNVLQKNPDMLDIQLSSLLRGPILIDTYNMSDEAGRATATDVDVLNTLEQIGRLISDRTDIFKKIMHAKTDISDLTLEELMIKDLKVTNRIPLVGFSLLVEEFLVRENAKEVVERFANERNCNVVVLIGQDVNRERVARDIAIFSTLCNQLANNIIQALLESTQPSLNLKLIKEIREEKCSLYLYKQGNVKVTQKCILPLGMEEGKIPDEAITASSSYEMKSVGPQNARIRQEKNGGAWCPKAQISSAIREYLEIDLTRDHLITWTETQGRFGNGQGQEYAEAFFLEYRRHEKWHQYKDLRGNKVLRGNSNTYLVEKQKLDLPFVASRVRFVPYSQHPRTVCMRVEIYGCIWNQDIASYTAPKADTDGPNGCNVEDTSYDGTEIENLMLNGLGQLTDGIVGNEIEILESNRVTNWVGWHDRDNIELFFEFQFSRKFRNCTIHVANLPDLSIEMFSIINFWFSSDGKEYHETPETFQMFNEPKINIISSNSNKKDGKSKKSIVISIPLQSRFGKFVKMDIKPQSKWLLLSEITFETDAKNNTDGALAHLSWIYANNNENISQVINQDQIGRMKQIEDKEIKGEIGDLEIETDNKIKGEAGDGRKINIQHGGIMMEKPKTDLNETTLVLNESNLTPDAFPVNNSPTYIGLISAALTIIVFFLGCTIFLIKQRGRNKVALLQKHTALLCGSPAPGITINTKDIKLPTPIVINNLSQSRLSLKSKITSNNDYKFGDVDTSEQHSIYEKINKISPRPYVKCEARSNYKIEHFDTKTSEDFADEVECIVPTMSKKLSHSQTGKMNQRVYESYYAATDILTIKRRDQHPVVSLFTPLLIRDSIVSYKRGTYNVPRISRHRLRILDKLGEGNFGLVHLCEAKGIQNPDLGILLNRQVVIVRSLWRGVVDALREDFMNDMHILAEIRDVNIARIIAIVEEEPFSAIFEYGELGDLSSFLKSHERDTQISYECSLNLVTQIASGMKYLESLNVPHCDLAARNCIVCKDLLIKVSDQAMYCNKYDNEYYVNECYAKIPLRWMAWEAVLSRKQSCQSDVWSYGVTVWEVLTRCEDVPYADMTSEQVLENCGLWYSALDNGSKKKCPRILEQPMLCTDDLYRLMLRCWCKLAEDRPSFQEIYCYLKKLTLD
ncbi:Discoidin domain-containing receptor 2 [Cyphomyrmex costatus]|uniref:Discoidin domain-containing receptor 2 n=1 Tax=Cyphomyrmex costatus TaxID=456900 RepID=A0A195D2L6_9HYME|nr:Discoidin domain-containing receptor 2 [Cyphomyrmex costatus]